MKKLEQERINAAPVLLGDREEQIRLVKHDLRELTKNKTKGAILRSRAKWADQGERPSKYYLNLEKQNYQKKTIFRLENDAGQKLDQEKEILEEIRTFYKKLYTSSGPINMEYIKKLKVPQISPTTREKLDESISRKEIADAIKSLTNGKCPGTDGLDPTFYKVFYTQISELLYNVYQESIQSGRLPVTTRQSIISLLEKLGQSPLKLKCWRPLSLLNTDNKIYGKILANRLQFAANEIIHESQQGFLAG